MCTEINLRLNFCGLPVDIHENSEISSPLKISSGMVIFSHNGIIVVSLYYHGLYLVLTTMSLCSNSIIYKGDQSDA